MRSLEREEKESLLCGLYNASYHLGVELMRYEQAKKSNDEKEIEHAKALLDFARGLQRYAEWCILDVYKDKNRLDSLDAKQMKDAIKTLKTMGEKGGHSLASEQIGRKQLVHIIRSMDIDDDEDHEPIPFLMEA